jgi:hypothetical protein
MEWNDPSDIALVTETFNAWAAAVIAKDRPKLEYFHDEGFRVRLGDRLLNRDDHMLLEVTVTNTQMDLISIEATRRIDDTLLVWSTHRITITEAPEIPSLGLFGDWGNSEALKQGFVQGEFTVWRFKGNRLLCAAFEIASFKVRGSNL